MEVEYNKGSLSDLPINTLKQWERLNEIEAKIEAMKEEKEPNISSGVCSPKYLSITQMSNKLKNKIGQMSLQERYLSFQPSLTELKNLLDLMEALSSTEHLFFGDVLRNEVNQSEYRLRRTRAGNRLKELIKDAMRQVKDKASIVVQTKDIDKQINKHLTDIPLSWDKTARNFVKAKLVNEKIIESQLSGKTVNFKVKYNRLDNYFWNKYQLCSSFVGEELKERQDRRRTQISSYLQLVHLKELYESTNVQPKQPEKKINIFQEIGNQIQQLINTNVEKANNLMSRVTAKLDVGQQKDEDAVTQATSASQKDFAEKRLKTQTNLEPLKFPVLRKTTQVSLKNKGLLSETRRPRHVISYTRKSKSKRLIPTSMIFDDTNHNPKQHKKLHLTLNSNILQCKSHITRSSITAKMHDYFDEAQRIIESINISEALDNAKIMSIIRKILMNSVEQRLQNVLTMKSSLLPLVSQIKELWSNVKTSSQVSIFSRLNGKTYRL